MPNYFYELPSELQESILADSNIAALHGEPHTWTEDTALSIAGHISGMPYIGLNLSMVDIEAYRSVGHPICERYHVLPLFKYDTVVVFACANPWAKDTLAALRQELHMEVMPIACTPAHIDLTLSQLELAERRVPTADEKKVEIHRVTRTGWDVQAKEGVITNTDLAKDIIRYAFEIGASDIHIEPFNDRLDIRFRVHGEMCVQAPIERAHRNYVLDGFKILADMRQSDQLTLKDGRIVVDISDKKRLDIRVTSLPTLYGENIVMRILDPDSIRRNMGALPFAGQDMELVKFCLSRTSGLVFLTGPTGSGKTTTLYKCLTGLNLNALNVRTVEDPIEYSLDRIVQTQIDTENNVTFVNTIRNILRADPDVILVGEVRDSETADLCVQAALTGHLVLSTLHTMDAVGVIPRLKDLHVSTQLIRSTLLLVIAQRLMGHLCAKCKEPIKPTDKMIKHFKKYKLDIPSVVYRQRTCQYCNFTGITGRLPIFEFLHATDDIKDAIGHDMPEAEIRALSLNYGHFPLAYHALKRVIAGEISYDEAQLYETELIK